MTWRRSGSNKCRSQQRPIISCDTQTENSPSRRMVSGSVSTVNVSFSLIFSHSAYAAPLLSSSINKAKRLLSGNLRNRPALVVCDGAMYGEATVGTNRDGHDSRPDLWSFLGEWS